MRRVIHKIFWIWQLEAEENWINEMASHGYSLEHAGRLTFEFDETEPGKYIYKEIFLKGWGESVENIKYFKFLEEMGIKVEGKQSEGTAHEFLTWRRGLHEFIPHLFKK